MDLTNMISGGAGEEKTPQQQLSKEEYAAMKKQQREEVWAEVDAQAQAVFQNGDSLKGFLDFMAQCNTQKTPNLLLIYGQNPEATVVKSYDYWKKEHRSPKSGVHGYTYMVSTEYEKDGEMRTGYAIGKGFDISQMSGKPLLYPASLFLPERKLFLDDIFPKSLQKGQHVRATGKRRFC